MCLLRGFDRTARSVCAAIARMKRFELQNHRKFRRATQFVFDDVAGDFLRQREWESHGILGLNRLVGRQNSWQRRVRRGLRRVGYHQPRQKKTRGRDGMRRIDAAASRAQADENRASGPHLIFTM